MTHCDVGFLLHLSLTVGITFSAEPPGGVEAELPEALLPDHQRTAEGEEGRAEGGAAEPREEGISGMCLEGEGVIMPCHVALGCLSLML